MIHLVQRYDTDKETARRIRAAEATWPERKAPWDQIVKLVYYELQPGERTSGDVGDSRCTPFVADVFEYGTMAGEVVAYTNSDISLCEDTWAWVHWSLAHWPCGYSLRADYNRPAWFPDHTQTVRQLNDDPKVFRYSGADLFWFTSAWWRRHRADWPDMILGYEAWDWVLKAMMRESGFVPPPLRLIYHERHESYWEAHRLDNPAQEHNRRLAMEWAERHGRLKELRHEMGAS